MRIAFIGAIYPLGKTARQEPFCYPASPACGEIKIRKERVHSERYLPPDILSGGMSADRPTGCRRETVDRTSTPRFRRHRLNPDLSPASAGSDRRVFRSAKAGKSGGRRCAPFFTSTLPPVAPRIHWMNSEKSGSWPTMATRLKSWNAASSLIAVSGVMPQASHPWMIAPGHAGGLAEFIRRLAGADQRAGENDVGKHVRRAFSSLAARRACSRPFSTSARAKSPSGLVVFGFAVAEEDEVHVWVEAEMLKFEMLR